MCSPAPDPPSQHPHPNEFPSGAREGLRSPGRKEPSWRLTTPVGAGKALTPPTANKAVTLPSAGKSQTHFVLLRSLMGLSF